MMTASGRTGLHGREQSRCIRKLADDLEAFVSQQPGDASPPEAGIVDEDHPQRRSHGHDLAVAEVHDTLDPLPNGYDTLLSRTFTDYAAQGDEGVLLSGGQWQRVALARALLRGDREPLLLDEPSSGLDARAEHRVHREITRHREGRTGVLVSHRLNTVRDVDRIAMLVAECVAEQGTHDELLAVDGAYARLFEVQAAGYRPVESRL